MSDSEERLDEEKAVECLNAALRLQHRSVVQYTMDSGSLFGFEFQSLGDRFWEFGVAELEDARLLVEKIVALGGRAHHGGGPAPVVGRSGRRRRMADRVGGRDD